MRTIHVANVAVIAGALLILAGCSGQRALSVIREEGDHAFAYLKYETARADFEEVVDRAPADWRYRLKLARTLMMLDEPKLAQEQFAVAHDIRPYDDGVVEDFAKSMYASEDFDRLITFLLLRAKDTQSVRDYLRLGWYAMETGDADLAERSLLTAARLDGGKTVDPRLALADFYAAAGNQAESLRQLRIALGVDPSNETVQKRIRSHGEIPGPSYALHPDSD